MRDTQLMGILNLTPDSFFAGSRSVADDVVARAAQMIEEGAKWIDLGGEASGPGSVDVTLEEELQRVIPAVQALRSAFPQLLISVDTWKSEVAEAAVLAGASAINDITAGRGDARIASVAARHGVPLILMYSKDSSARTTREAVQYTDVVATVKGFLQERMAWARAQGVGEVWIDPGMGAFVSAEPKYSWELIERIEEFYTLDCPILVGASRKGFLGEDRLGGTLRTTELLKGKVDVLRVHDVLENAKVLA